MARSLGLDLGPNSIGWALVEDNGPENGSRIVDMGVRVFPEGVAAFDTAKEKSKSENRRIKRGQRRQCNRRRRRKQLLLGGLTACGLWPADPTQRRDEFAKDPYVLRERAVTEALEPFEIGRVILHLSQRRGFLSNRKKEAGDKEAEGMLAEINSNEAERVSGGYKTIGAMLAAKAAKLKHTERVGNDHVRKRHLSRQQIVDEFLMIWNSQRVHHPALLTDRVLYGELGPVKKINPRTEKEELSIAPRASIKGNDQRRDKKSVMDAFGLFGIVFFQRRLYWPRSIVGQCELEPNQKRCPKADRQAERFRILQDLNNLRFFDRGEETTLSDEQRETSLSLLRVKERVTFDELRKKLGLLEGVRFNLERGSRSSFKGMVVDVKLAKVIGKKEWHDRDEDEKTKIVRLLLNDQVDEGHRILQLHKRHGFAVDVAEKLVAVDLGPGFANLSRKAIVRLLPYMEKGLTYQAKSDPALSAIHAAGYTRRDELQRHLFDHLPDLSRLKPSECRLGDIPNPVVKRALVELRKVVNAIIREYGKPDQVHVELARTVQVGSERRKEMSKRMRDREKLRDEAAAEIRSNGFAVRREAITRHLLWKEQNHECIYCGKPLSVNQLFGGEVDVDHILPRFRSLDDSQMNKVVCCRSCNQDKDQRTPYEWLAASRPDDYERVIQHAASLMRKGMIPYAKYRRFQQKELELDKFISRQLVDTSYISKATVEYLQLLFDRPGCVLGMKGQLTAELRHQWGLDTILSEMTDSPAWIADENNELPAGQKTRADHRHHAIDALVVAMTNRGRLQELSELYRRGGVRAHGEVVGLPWDKFREDVVAQVRSINVSHRVQRKVSGALHEETNYSSAKDAAGRQIPGEWVVRKPVSDLSASEVERIRDGAIRRLVIERLEAAGIQAGRGEKIDRKKFQEVLADLSMPSGVPIKKVRLSKPEGTIRDLYDGRRTPATYVKPGSTHHLCIFEFSEGGQRKREAIFVTMLEAIQRINRGEPIIQRIHPSRPKAMFIMSLSSREMVCVDDGDNRKILTFKTAASTQGQIYFADQYDARRSSEQKKVVFNANTLKAQKITVDPLGRVRWAND